MAIKVLECRRLIRDSQCKLLFVGEIDEITKAFTDHAASAHGDVQGREFSKAIEGEFQNAVFVEEQRCYIGDQYEQQGPDSIRIPGPGFVLRRFYEEAAVSLTCKCGAGGGGCTTGIHGTLATCNNDTCTNCGWDTTIPTVVAVDPPEFE